MESKEAIFKVPSSPSTSSPSPFKAPYPPSSSSTSPSPAIGAVGGSGLKQRRVSLALPSNTPKVVPEWSFRDDTGIESSIKGKGKKDDDDTVSTLPTSISADAAQEKRTRKKWSQEETDMLVRGCNKHGVGNWKTILSDPELTFDNRSPVDLKDRFRTYFPDAYKKHYPNARTHLSSKVRSTLPDGSSLFEKTRSKKRRPFSEEEDRALKAGYEKHGTVWATIVKDPVFQEQNRKSTDLRDRFRNAFPELYQAAGYKPRKKIGDAPGIPGGGPVRSTTDDLAAGPARRRRRHTSQGIFRGGTKSVPQSATPSEDEYSSGEEEQQPLQRSLSHHRSPSASAATRRLRSPTRPKRSSSLRSPPATPALRDVEDDSMDSLMTMNSLTNVNPFAELMGSSQSSDFLGPSSSQSDMDANWSSGLDTPTHSSHQAWSPTSSHLSADYLTSPYERRDGLNFGNGNNGTIGKSAWGGDWFSATNPRMDNSISPAGGAFFDTPASPFAFSNHLNHGVLERYDLAPAPNAHDFLSEGGGGAGGDGHDTFSDDMFPPSSGFRGFTHHSNYAGDLIFGARTQSQQQMHEEQNGGDSMLGLTGMTQAMQILPGIEEMGVQDSMDVQQSPQQSGAEQHSAQQQTQRHSPPNAHQHHQSHQPTLTQSHSHPGAMQHQSQQQLRHQRQQESASEPQLAMDDIVHSTPPGTPLLSPAHSRPHHLRHRSVDMNRLPYSQQQQQQVLGHGQSSSSSSSLASRSISVPPRDNRVSSRDAAINSSAMGLTAASKALFQQQQQQQQQHQHGGAGLMMQTSLNYGFPDANNQSSNEFFNVPYLDLHYYNNAPSMSSMAMHLAGNSGGDGMMMHQDMYSSQVNHNQRQALDLATTGLKAVCPQDLLLTAHPGSLGGSSLTSATTPGLGGEDGRGVKGKRASWGKQ